MVKGKRTSTWSYLSWGQSWLLSLPKDHQKLAFQHLPVSFLYSCQNCSTSHFSIALETGPIESTLKSSWYLEAEEMVTVLARTSNRVKELLVEEGDEVIKDQVLARLEDQEQRTAVDKARNQVEKMAAEFVRVKKLFDQSLISEKEYTDVQFEVRQLELLLE